MPPEEKTSAKTIPSRRDSYSVTISASAAARSSVSSNDGADGTTVEYDDSRFVTNDARCAADLTVFAALL
jgi:hypothetical protein